ncbi:MAG: DivIVA domain-containing protein [Lachnospiraceae bacterium]|nr:DivIVA domain-containing protein [Lachnospiraceae bacterium]
MLTPVEFKTTEFKLGRGYKKQEMDEFLQSLFTDYETLYNENMELKNKVQTLSDGLQYYKGLEKTLQKTLIVAEKTAEETKGASVLKANAIEQEAQVKANEIVGNAKAEANNIYNQTTAMIAQYENIRARFKEMLSAQMELLEAKSYQIKIREDEFPYSYKKEAEAFVAQKEEEEATDKDVEAYLNKLKNEAKEAQDVDAKEFFIANAENKAEEVKDAEDNNTEDAEKETANEEEFEVDASPTIDMTEISAQLAATNARIEKEVKKEEQEVAEKEPVAGEEGNNPKDGQDKKKLYTIFKETEELEQEQSKKSDGFFGFGGRRKRKKEDAFEFLDD